MKAFWNDADGLTTVDILATTLGIGTILAYWRYGCVDTNYADIVVAALIASAGQRVGISFSGRGLTMKGGETSADYRNESQV